MSSHTSGDLKERILRFFAKNPQQVFKSSQIARRLSITTQQDYNALLHTLEELVKDKQISQERRKRYGRAQASEERRVVGILSMLKSGDGIVKVSLPREVKVKIGQKFLGTGLDGDTVTVDLFAASVGAETENTEELEGEISEVIERSNKPIVGVLGKNRNALFVVPDDRRFGRDIYISKEKKTNAKPGDKVVVIVDDWTSAHLNPEGHIIEVLGKSGEVSAEMAGVARDFRLPLHFPKDVLAEAEKIDEAIPPEEIKQRLDLRELVCFTIDPEDAKDFDDAVSLELDKEGNYLLGVHIADVSHYVKEGTILEQEAFSRATSVYLADEVIPMLPEKLSNNICSLRPNVERLTYTAFMTVTPKGIVTDYKIGKSVILSKRRFTYEEVQKVIETGKGDFSDTIQLMQKLSKILYQKRYKDGSIDFDTVETKFRFDDEGKPTEIIKKVRLDAHRLVEDFMLLANQTVAKHIGLSKKEENVRPFVYRIHDTPNPDKLSDLASFVGHLGYSLNLSGGVTSRALQKLLQDVKGKVEEDVINEVAIRSMAKAIYSVENIGHFGLGFRYYTHFTSPIRRFPDLVVHRLLHEYEHKISQKRREQLSESLPGICDHSSDMERNAMEAERASVKVMQVEYMKRHLGDEFDAIISGVTNFGMFVEITNILVEGLIRVRDLGDDYYMYDEKSYSLIGRHKKKRYRLGDKITVKVIRVNPEERKIDFALIGK